MATRTFKLNGQVAADGTYAAFIGLLTRVYSHVDQKFVAGIEGLAQSWTSLPVANKCLISSRRSGA